MTAIEVDSITWRNLSLVGGGVDEKGKKRKGNGSGKGSGISSEFVFERKTALTHSDP